MAKRATFSYAGSKLADPFEWPFGVMESGDDQKTYYDDGTGHESRAQGCNAGQNLRGDGDGDEEPKAEAILQGGDTSETDQDKASDSSYSKLLIRYLYAGHFLARWGARMWEFSVGLYFISLWPNSLLFAAIYGVVESASIALFGAVVGRWVDRSTYAKVLQFWLVTQNFSFLIAGCTVVALLVFSNMKSENFLVFILLVILVNFSGAVGVLSTLAGTILIEREWVVVISEGSSPEALTRMNSVIRRLDLVSKLFAPVLSGLIISFISLKASAITLACWNMASLWLQYWLLISVYKGIPSLRESNQRRTMGTRSSNQEETLPVYERRVLSNPENCNSNEDNPSKSSFSGRNISKILDSSFVSSWRRYLQQEVLLPGIALALLYFTVLSFGTLMTATLRWEGIAAYIIGIARGISATIGIAATLAYPILQSKISTLRTGVWSVWSQWAFLGLCITSIWIQNKYAAAYMLMTGVAASRLGLWMFDLAVTQLMQDAVAESDRGVVGGVQNSLQSAMDLMANVMGIIVSDPQDFWKLTILSYAAVTLSASLYTLHTYRVRKHLFHFEKVLALLKWSIKTS